MLYRLLLLFQTLFNIIKHLNSSLWNSSPRTKYIGNTNFKHLPKLEDTLLNAVVMFHSSAFSSEHGCLFDQGKDLMCKCNVWRLHSCINQRDGKGKRIVKVLHPDKTWNHRKKALELVVTWPESC